MKSGKKKRKKWENQSGHIKKFFFKKKKLKGRNTD